MRPEPNTRVTLISPSPRAVYSGMVPGTLVGLYGPDDGAIDVAALAARAGASFYSDTVVRVNTERRIVETASRGEIPYDLLSLDVGSRPLGIEAVRDLPDVVGAKPVEEAAPRIAAFLDQARSRGTGRVVVVGAGSGGIEVAFALRKQLPATPGGHVTLVEAGPAVLPAGSDRMRRLVERLLRDYGIETHVGRRFTSSEAGTVRLDDGTTIPAELVVWATGAEGLPFLTASGLATDERGFVRVDDHLRCVTAPEVFAVGDCARMESHPAMPRAGVFAVRQGPIVEENLRRSLRGRSLLRYRPQSEFLSLLSTGDGRAAMSYRGLAAHGPAWWRLKDWIDRRFIEKYAPPKASTLRRGPDVAATMPMEACGGCAAKVDPDMLARVLSGLTDGPGMGLPIGLAAADDAAVLTPPKEGNLVFTVDAFPPFLADPLLVGEVAALNALSDVYAMGGTPTAALALVGVSARDGASREADLRQMMSGARAALDRLDVPLAGGHSIETDAPLIGFAVIGSVYPDATMTKGGASVGDRIVLTKPLGTGVVLAATRAGECPPEWTEATITSMREANDVAARCLNDAGVRCCTDVSGFGLAGHLAEMLRASDVGAEIYADALPALPGALELLRHEWRSSADAALADSLRQAVAPIDLPGDDPRLGLLRDPQTSGGLVAAVPQRLWPEVRRRFADASLELVPIGTVVSEASGQIRVRSGGLVDDGASGLHQPHES